MTIKITKKPRQKGTLVYTFETPARKRGRILFINLIPEYDCINNCRFCSRKDAIEEKPNIYEKKAGANLYLQKTPTPDEILTELQKQIKKPFLGLFGGTKEIAIVGLGEPLMNLDLVIEVIHAIRTMGFKKTIRLDTNGLANALYPPFVFGCFELISRKPALELADAGLDEIRISLNATSLEEYLRLCRTPDWVGKTTLHGGLLTPLKKDIFSHLCDFVRDCVHSKIKTFVSFVIGFEDGEVKTKTPEEYQRFSKETFNLDTDRVILRQYIPPLS
ncbi:MAG: radical SAM protein [Candidatus ainarchaeum sp.]|nr:radical SAM protein [Candidatus ainarchaeum sp.]